LKRIQTLIVETNACITPTWHYPSKYT